MLFRKEFVRFENWDAADANDTAGFAYRGASDNADTAVPAANPDQAAADAAALGLGGSQMTPNVGFATASGTDESPF